MKSGLYEWPGRSATERAAAWASRLLLPTTNVENVYRVFSVGAGPDGLPVSADRCGSTLTAGAVAAARTAAFAVTKRTSTVRPTARCNACFTFCRYLLSSHS